MHWGLRLREAQLDDCELFFEWVNDLEVRKNALNSKNIYWNEHKSWFEKAMSSLSSVKLFVGIDENDEAVGQIRFEKDGVKAVIDISVDSRFRQQGLGKQLLEQGIKRIEEFWQDVSFIEAVVKIGNASSQRLFEAGGFKKSPDKNANGFHRFALKLRR